MLLLMNLYYTNYFFVQEVTVDKRK